MTLHDELVKIQKELKAPKGRTNKFGGYKYRSLEDIMEAFKGLNTGLSLTFEDRFVTDNTIECHAILSDGKERISRVAIVGVDRDKKGMDVAQSFGASSSYGRKYAANGLFCIDDTQDADATNDHGKGPKKEKSGKPPLTKSSPNYAKVAKRLAEGDTTIDQVKEYFSLSPEIEAELTK